jgi:hypothetical protein
MTEIPKPTRCKRDELKQDHDTVQGPPDIGPLTPENRIGCLEGEQYCAIQRIGRFYAGRQVGEAVLKCHTQPEGSPIEFLADDSQPTGSWSFNLGGSQNR